MQLFQTTVYEEAWDRHNVFFAAETQHAECPQVSRQNLLQATAASAYLHLAALLPISEPSFFHASGPLQLPLAAQVSQLINVQIFTL